MCEMNLLIGVGMLQICIVITKTVFVINLLFFILPYLHYEIKFGGGVYKYNAYLQPFRYPQKRSIRIIYHVSNRKYCTYYNMNWLFIAL